MRMRKFSLSFISLLFVLLLVGCSKNVEYSGGCSQPDTIDTTNILDEKQKNNADYTSTTKVIQKNNIAKSNEVVTSNIEKANDITYVPTTVESAENEKVQNCTINIELSTEESVVTEAITDAPTTVNPTSEAVLETEIQTETQNEYEPNIPNDSLVIRKTVINLVYGDASRQALVDANDAVYDTVSLSNEYNTMIFGHSYKKFEILDTMFVGEKFYLNYHGSVRSYEVQESGLAELNEYKSDVTFVGSDKELLYTDLGYHSLFLITCDKQDPVNRRWLVIAKEVFE